MARRENKQKVNKYFDYNLLFLVIFLLCFGLVMLYSSSAYISGNKYDDSTYFLRKQLRNIALGSFALTFFAAIDYRRWKKWGGAAYLIAFVLCVLVLIPGIGSSSHGSSRWIQIAGIQFQPSEVSKLAIIIFLASVIEKIPRQLAKFSSILKIMAIMLPLVGVIAYSNLSTAVIVMGIAVCMLFVASPKYSHFFALAGAGIVFIVVFIMAAGYRMGRVEAWLHPETAGDAGYQTLMGLYAIGSGGLFGKGLGGSLQKLGNVPESQNDMIFTIICEELGLFGAICVILLFLLLIWRMMVIANNARDLFGALLVVGIMSHIAIQVILNIAVVTNTIPNTGVILPFISYGGTSIIFLMGEMGLALSVSRGIRLEQID